MKVSTVVMDILSQLPFNGLGGGGGPPFSRHKPPRTDKKEKENLSHIRGNSEVSCAKSYMTNGLLIHGEKFPHILGSPCHI